MVNNKENIKKALLDKRIVNSLTLKEKNNLIDIKSRPVVDEALKKYSEINSRAKYEKVLEKADIEGLIEEDFYMAFYNNDNNNINDKLLAYIEEQEWFVFFVQALVNFNNISDCANDDSKYSMPYSVCFLAIEAKEQICKYIESLSNINVQNIAVSKMIDQLVNNTLQIFSKTVIYEYHLNKSKYTERKNSNRLNQYIKDTFVETHSIIEFYLKYPVLIRRLAQKILHMLNYYKEVLFNLDKSYNEMKEKKLVIDNMITDISCDMGDTHEKGKFVLKIYFNQNSVIYKPRNLFITKKYYSFIEWINKRFNLYKLPTVNTIWSDTYTVEECITYESCETELEIERFYSRIGYYIATLYLFSGNDIHFENIIACKEYPYIIDLETLFAHNSEQLIYKNMAVENIARKIHQSVKGSCLLPSYMFRNQKEKGVDISGLGGKRAELPGKRLVLSNLNSDDIKFEMQKGYIENNDNIPMLINIRVDYLNYVDCILLGFLQFMNLIKDNKEEFIQKVEMFNYVKTRQVLRATNNYGYILQFASHPSYTQNMIYLERMFETVWNHPYINMEVASCEVEELLEDDIPVFYCFASGKDIFSGRGKKISNLYQYGCIDTVLERIKTLDDREIKLQKYFIQDSLGRIQYEANEEVRKIIDNYKFMSKEKIILNREKIHIVLQNIEKILEKNGIYGNGDISWIGLIDDGFSNRTISYLSSNMFDGLSGILLYLLLVTESEKNDATRKMVKKILVSLANIEGVESKKNEINAMFGICSAIYPLYLFIQSDLNNEAITLFDSVISWTFTLLENLDEEVFSSSGIATIIILAFNLFEKSSDYKFYKLGKKAVEIVIEYGIYFIVDKSIFFEIDEIAFAMQLSNKYLCDEKVTEFIEKLVCRYRQKIYGKNYINLSKNEDLFNEVEVSPISCIYKLKYYYLCNDSFLLNEINKCIDKIKSVFEPDIKNKLFRIDLLLEYNKIFADNNEIINLCEKELQEIIDMYGMTSEDVVSKYDYVINGLGLNSPISGLGYRLLKYVNSEYVDLMNFI